MDKDHIIVYTDGSCNNHTGNKGGFGIVMKYKGNTKEFYSGSFLNTTSSRMEIMAVVVALEKIKNPELHKVKIFSDSQYVVNTINKEWIHKWELENWVGRKNTDLWKRFLSIYKQFQLGSIKMIWVKGHNGDLLNERADELASIGASLNNFIIDKK